MWAQVLKKYLLLLWSFVKTSTIADLEFRANFWAQIVTDIFWYAAHIFTFEVIYKHTQYIGSWNLEQMRVFLAIIFIVDAFYMMFLHNNLEGFTEKIIRGDLDLLLAKPVNSQFMISFQKFLSASVGNLVIALAWFVFSLAQIENFIWYNALWLLLFIPTGVLTLYCIRFMFAASAIIFTNAYSFQFLWYQIYKLGMRPDSIYFPWMRILFFTVIPVSMIASVPTRSLFEPPDFALYLWALVLPFLLLYITNKYWHFCLKRYSSASS